MCFATVGMIMAGVGAATSAIGTISAGSARADAASQAAQAQRYQAQVAKNNQDISRRNADYAEAAGLRQAEIKQNELASKTGRLRAAIAANGVDVNTGSASEVQASEKMLGTTDVETVLSNAALKSYGYRSQAANYGANSTLLNREAAFGDSASESIREGSYFAAGGDLLSKTSSLPLKLNSGQKYDTIDGLIADKGIA